MMTASVPQTTNLISAKAAADLIPYSRDYIARIAREGKITAVQIDRQWFVESTSLQNFYEQSLIEEEVRKRHLSKKRKLELEVKEQYQTRLEQLQLRRSSGPLQAAILAALVLFGGVSSGFLFLNGDSGTYLATILGSQVSIVRPVTPVVIVQGKTSVDYWVARDAVETTRPLSLRDGIVLLPAEDTRVSLKVRDLFSDEVTVTLTSSSTGVIAVDQNGIKTTMPFVRIPSESRAEVVTATESSESAP